MSIQREWQKFVRPPRYNYSYFDLGPEIIQTNNGYIQRRECLVTNRQNCKLEMSFFQITPVSNNTIIYCHGYNGCRIEGIKYATIAAQYGFNFCVFDFQGCGHSEGDYITFGHLEKEDINSIIQELQHKFYQTAFILWGRSLGATTIQLQKNQLVKAYILDSCFINFNKLAVSIIQKQTRLPKFLIKAIIYFTKGSIEDEAGFQFNNIQVECDSNIPTLYLCSEKDTLIKSKNTIKLYKQHQGIKKLIKVEGEHNDSRSAEVIHQICQWSKDRINPISLQQKHPLDLLQYSSVPQVSRLPLELLKYDSHSNIRSSSALQSKGGRNPAKILKNQISIQLRTSSRNLQSVIY